MKNISGRSALLIFLVFVAVVGVFAEDDDEGHKFGGDDGHKFGHKFGDDDGKDFGDEDGRESGDDDGQKLKRSFYEDSCPGVERLIRDITWSKTRDNPALGAKLLRLHYHDCFVRGCDASILLDKVGTTPHEKEARPNLSLGGFDVIDDIKTQVEEQCPGVVSCADIVALAARDAVSFPFQEKMWEVLTGRRDGSVSLASDVSGNLPSPFANFSTLSDIFSSKGLDLKDLVALSGAHTIGVSHCGAVSRRLYNFTGKGDVDPSLDSTYADFLRTKCSNPADPATTVEMDPQSSLSFDNHYFEILTENKGLFQSDAALLTDKKSVNQVRRLQRGHSFFSQFAKSMMKMGAVEVLTGNDGEIRKQCRVVNS